METRKKMYISLHKDLLGLEIKLSQEGPLDKDEIFHG